VLFKILPNVKIAWRDVWIGALVTAVLVVMGGVLVGIYFRLGELNSAVQAAGGFAILLIGIYYIAQIFLLGAIFTRVYTSTFGSKSYPIS
jgi:membrane protein